MLIDNSKVIVEKTFNDHYVNIVEKLSGQKPCNFCFGHKFTGRWRGH